MDPSIFVGFALTWNWGSPPSIEAGPMLYFYQYQTGENVSIEPATIGYDWAEDAGFYGVSRMNTSLLVGPRLRSD